MPIVTFPYQDQSALTTGSQNPSGKGSWIIPIFLVVLISGVAIVVFSKPPLKNAFLRLLSFHSNLGMISRSKSVQSVHNIGSEVRDKRSSRPYIETTFAHPREFTSSQYPSVQFQDNVRQLHARSSLSCEPVDSRSSQHDIPVLCSAFSEESFRSLRTTYEEDRDNCRPQSDDKIFDQITVNDLVDVPELLLTPPTVEDLASLSISPVGAPDHFLRPPSVDRFGHAVLQSRSFPSSDSAIAHAKPKPHRFTSVIGNHIVVADRQPEESFSGELTAALHDSEKLAEKLRIEANMITRETQAFGRRRSSITVKVSVPSSNDLWKFWVTRDQTLEQFTARVREKVGADVALFTHMEDRIVSEEDWRSVRAENKIIAHLI